MNLGLLGRLKRRPKSTEFQGITPSLTPPPKDTSKVSLPISANEDSDTVEVSRDPDSKSEQKEVESLRGETLKNNSYEQDMIERKRYADKAYSITQSWIGFLIVITIFQAIVKPMKMGLSEKEFITVFTTTTASVFGYWLLVGQYLFPRQK